VGKTSEEITEPIIRDRQTLSSEGVVVIMALAGKAPSVEVITRGVSQNQRELNLEIERIALESLNAASAKKRTLPTSATISSIRYGGTCARRRAETR
jgi:ribonuclease J